MINVEKEVYEKVINRDNYKCVICEHIEDLPSENIYNYFSFYYKLSTRIRNLELHHILYRSEKKVLINDVDNCIMLCSDCHRLVHKNKKLWQPVLIKLNKKRS